ncbi:MAG TPA: cell division protein ZapA [Blastocatellia bacterium]|nr:cell division protein ZapA [Blastocatellia bacterium]
MDTAPGQPIKVVIYNQTYTLRSDHSPEYIQELADYVNERMNEIASATMTVDSLRVAILAALQIADELHVSRREGEQTEREIAERSSRYADLLDQFLRPEPADKSNQRAE